MRHLDYLFSEWDLEAEPSFVRERVARIREGVDRYQIYLEALDGGNDLDPALVFESQFERGWLGRRWTLARELSRLWKAPLADDRARPLLVFLAGRARAAGRLLARLERARARGRTEEARALRERLDRQEDELARIVRRQALDLFRAPTARRCPACGARHVQEESYFGGMVLLGCQACLCTESGREGSPELAALLARWSAAP